MLPLKKHPTGHHCPLSFSSALGWHSEVGDERVFQRVSFTQSLVVGRALSFKGPPTIPPNFHAFQNLM